MPPSVRSRRVRSELLRPHWLSRGIMDRAPNSRKLLQYVLRNRHEVRPPRQGFAVMQRPIEETQYCPRPVAAFGSPGDQDVARARDRPTLRTRRICRQLPARFVRPPPGRLRSGTKCVAPGLDEPPVMVTQRNITEMMSACVGVLDVPDRELGSLHECRHAFAPDTPHARRPHGPERGANLRPPACTRARQIVGPEQRAARRVAPMHHCDISVWQYDIRVECRNRCLVPAANLSQIDLGEQRTSQLELPGPYSRHADHRHDATQDDRKLHQTRSVKLLRS